MSPHWEQATSLTALLRATHRAARGKRDQPAIARFLMDAESECLRLRDELRRPLFHPQSYQPGPPRAFFIRDPKPRCISELPFRDRVAHHALCAVLEPALERYAIVDSFACRIGKGQHAALRRAQQFARAERDGWYFKGDIAAFFASIPHDRLLALLRRRMKDAEVLQLVERIVRAYPSSAEHGLPIGALTSQHLANLYLGALDHQIKDNLGVRRYLRYMDDFLAFGTREGMLKLRGQVEDFLGNSLGLRLNSGVSQVRPVHDGVPFLGMRCYPSLIRPSAKRWRRFRDKHAAIEAAIQTGEVTEQKAAQCLSSQYAHFAKFSTYRLRENHLTRLQGSNGSGVDPTRREPFETGRLVGQRRAEPACGQPRQRRPVQPQREPGFSLSEFRQEASLQPGATPGPEADGLRSGGLCPGSDPIYALRSG